MKDLKQLYYFENLLDEANNELIREAKKEGKLAIGYTCFHMPEVLLNLDNCFSLRMRAPKTGSMEIATYYMSNYTCEFCRALLERTIEGGYNFLDAIAGVDACAMMNRTMENIELLNLVDKKGFFVSHVDVPYKVNDDAVEHYVQQIQLKVLNKLRENLGVDISETSMRKAVEIHNEVCRIITEIGEFRKEDNPRITGYEFHILNLVSYVCPKYLIVDKLRETLDELKTREPDDKKNFRAKVVVVGSEIDDPELTKLIEESGALIVADRFCFGSFPGRQEIILKPGERVLDSICRQYLEQSLCPRYVSHEKINQRRDFAENLYKDYHADGIIYEQIKFCDYWGYERALTSHIMTEERGIPTLSIDRPYMSRTSGQLRTRVQAFVESLEIKKIQRDRKKEALANE
ncbi:MAG: 2-hydroxyacyl-CoA dehydratase family protein [Clostridium sp.]|uniref:2-hydroxyacyl-CoA dehydratase family protein n=1 Tax=Clostridium sp. TaxID=1506 RepID=UPI002A8E445D|nr:2-hydroxyacyl-CoA dehydratase family protein [Clostridium sp.]MDY5097131.1 2-hydroxyacyl-CoA dehydratase family protein [Clostridium sp.]